MNDTVHKLIIDISNYVVAFMSHTHTHLSTVYCLGYMYMYLYGSDGCHKIHFLHSYVELELHFLILLCSIFYAPYFNTGVVWSQCFMLNVLLYLLIGLLLNAQSLRKIQLARVQIFLTLVFIKTTSIRRFNWIASIIARELE